MASLGPYLREHRERRGLSVEEMARATRVAGRYLAALEADDFRVLPAPVFTKGFIRAYCQAVGVDAEEALTRYHEQTGEPVPAAIPAVTVPEKAVPAETRSRGTVLVSFVLLVVLGLALFAVTLALQSGREDRRARQGAPQPEPPTSATAPATPTTSLPAPAREPAETSTPPLAPTPAPFGERRPTRPAAPAPSLAAPPTTPERRSPLDTARPAPPAATVTPPVPMPTPAPPAPPAPTARPPASTPTPSTGAPSTATPPANAAPRPSEPATPPQTAAVPGPAAPSQVAAAVGAVTSPYRLVARVSEPTWIRVRMDDGRSTEETIPAGEIREWVSNGPFVLTVGNAGGVTLELNGRALPPLGGRGAVISRIVIPPAQQ